MILNIITKKISGERNEKKRRRDKSINRYANTIYDLYYNSKYFLFEFKFKIRITIEMHFIYRDCIFFMKCMKY